MFLTLAPHGSDRQDLEGSSGHSWTFFHALFQLAWGTMLTLRHWLKSRARPAFLITLGQWKCLWLLCNVQPCGMVHASKFLQTQGCSTLPVSVSGVAAVLEGARSGSHFPALLCWPPAMPAAVSEKPVLWGQVWERREEGGRAAAQRRLPHQL